MKGLPLNQGNSDLFEPQTAQMWQGLFEKPWCTRGVGARFLDHSSRFFEGNTSIRAKKTPKQLAGGSFWWKASAKCNKTPVLFLFCKIHVSILICFCGTWQQIRNTVSKIPRAHEFIRYTTNIDCLAELGITGPAWHWYSIKPCPWWHYTWSTLNKLVASSMELGISW